MVDNPLRDLLQSLVEARLEDSVSLHSDWVPLPTDLTAILASVASSQAREGLPELERRFDQLNTFHKMNVVAARPARFFVPAVVSFLAEAWSFRVGEQAGQLLVQHASFLTGDDLQRAPEVWALNSQCREALQMPDLAVTLLHDTRHLGRTRLATFAQFLATVQSLAKEGDSYYRYPALEMALQAAGHLAESG